MISINKIIMLVLVVVNLTGCSMSSINNDDPFETYNRKMYDANHQLDEKIVEPVAKAYDKYANKSVKTGVNNFFNNIKESRDAVNSILQGKMYESVITSGRIAINTTIGIVGIVDMASMIGLEKQEEEDFGQTLGFWGVPAGPYIVLPIYGPSNLRDLVGLGVDIAEMEGFQSLYNIHKGVRAPLNVVNERVKYNMIISKINESENPYDMTKTLYEQKREFDINGEEEIDF